MVNERETGKSAGVLLAALSVYVSRAKDFTARTYAFPGQGLRGAGLRLYSVIGKTQKRGTVSSTTVHSFTDWISEEKGPNTTGIIGKRKLQMEFAAYMPVWDKLTQAQRVTLASCVSYRTVKKDEVIHHGDVDCMGLLLIRQGQLKAFMLSEDGREITLYRLFDRDICLFSAGCMMRSLRVEIMVQAEKDTDLWVIPAETYKQLMEESAVLSNFTNEMMAGRISDVMWLMEQVLWKSFDKRLAGYLLEEAAIEQSIMLRITHESIGKHLGNPREVVTRMLHYFQKEGLVRLSRGTIEITDEPKLRRLSQ